MMLPCDQGQDEVAAAVAVRAEQPIEADLARCAEGRVDMTNGNERMMVMASWSLGMTVPPLSSALKPAIRSCGQSDRFNSVRFLTPACAGAGSCRPRGSSRATGWPGASRDWGPLRYTWQHHSDRPPSDK